MSEFGAGRSSRRQFLFNAAMAAAAVGVGGGALAGCGQGGSGAAGGGGGGKGGGRSGKQGETLFIAGFQWGPPTHFNPLGQSTGWPCGQGAMQLVYETLVRFNLLNGKLEPGLGKELQTPDDTTIVVPLQDGAKWQDGKPLTADDVVYTFELAKRHTELSYASFWDYVDKIEASDPQTVKLTLGRKPFNPAMAKNSLAGTYILPKHVWEPLEKQGKPMGQFENLKPVGSGPYKVDSYNQQQISLTRQDNYWGKSAFGGLPKPKYIVHPIFKGNQDGDLRFQRGGVDVMQQFTPQIWKMWEDKKLAVSTWYKKPPYHVPGGMPMLVINTTKKGLDNPAVRRALAFAINYQDIADKAMSRYSKPANSSVILPTGGESKFFDKDAVAANGWKYDPEQTKKILEGELKAKKGSDGIYVLPDGTRLGPWTAQTPTGWSDWQNALRIVANNAKAAGIEITTKFPQAPNVTSSVQAGDFDLACWGVASTSAATPWQRFRDVLDDRGVAKLGQPAFWNYGRFKDPAVAKLLDEAAGASDDAAAKQAYGKLDEIFMKNAPMIPLMYRPLEFYEFNETNWKNFPNEQNAYAPPMFSGAGVSWLFKIKRVSES
ncbi:ABC transporter substrate-binding protein [Actinopolymorpha singaporensis]|uniref:Peptide/nickel transport system substrate-binding protein n=1 Tax=Actinopolymorpha singaporensis TaxID=117157 RepID=A0A1H1T596_9ACTN|nr:ABC transporter substrate-binding protein [Actinopolymorpha singaporensis]SDS55186.1 peptide/nickel transport system substrate-binding protein [Actinopolymorpha singaporensis]